MNELPMNATRPIPDEFWPLVDAACTGELTEPQRAELEKRLEGDPAVRRAFLDHIRLCTQIRLWQKGQRSLKAGLAMLDADLGASRGLESPAPQPAVPVSPIIIDTSSPVSAPRSAIFAPGGWLFSYAASVVLVGFALLIGWAWRVSHDYQLATASPQRTPGIQRNMEPALELVGHVSGTADCRWAGPAARAGAAVRLGGKYALASGLMEIRYDTGARVILQGPCTYEVDSLTGGFLSLGKLTARVAKSEIRNPKLESPNPSSLFAVRTPTATVTDLGTEFGVEVDKSGTTRSHVFRGKVELRVAAPGKKNDGQMIPLGENESARVEVGPQRSVTMIRAPVGERKPARFAREMPKLVRMSLFSTGVRLNEGDADPHWQLVARSDDPHFQPQPAVVTSLIPANRERASVWAPNDPALSQWISTANHAPELPNGVTYTFRTSFELPGLVSGRAAFHGWFAVDNEVRAIRLNGRPLDVPKCNFDPRLFHSFAADTGFVEGTNTLEFDVFNGSSIPADDAGTSGPMLLRVELEGTFVGTAEPPAHTAAAASETQATPPQPRAGRKPEKGDQSMNGP